MKRNSLNFIKILLVTFCIYAGCSKQPRLNILGENSSNLRAIESISHEYHAKHSISFRPNTFEDAINKANHDFSNHTALYDIVLQVNFSLSNFVRNNYVYSLDELLEYVDTEGGKLDFQSDLFDKAWKEVGYYSSETHIDQESVPCVGYPFATNTMLLLYNKDMFDDADNKRLYQLKYNEELSVPTSWEQYVRIADFFTNKENKTYGVCMQGANGGWLYYEYCCFLYGMGGSIFDKEFGWQSGQYIPITINTKTAEQATELYQSLKPFNAGNFIAIDAVEQINILQNGNVAMGIVWSDYLYNIVNNEKHKVNFGFAPIPGNTSPLAGGCFYVNRDSKHAKEAMEFIIELMQPSNQIELAKKGLCSPLRSTYNDPEVQQIPYSGALKESLERGEYMFEAGPEADAVMSIITNYIQKLWNQDLSTKDALQAIESDIKNERIKIYRNIDN